MSRPDPTPGSPALRCVLTLCAALILGLPAASALAAAAGAGAGTLAGRASAGTRAQALLQASDAYWTHEFVVLKASYAPPVLSIYGEPLRNACGTSGLIVGPFYCPDESRIYLPQRYLQQVQIRAGDSADLALAYVVGHEVGAHVQDLIGTTAQVEQARARSTAQLSAQTWRVAELQADCYAGLWVRAGQAARQVAPGDASRALQAVASVTDEQQSHLQRGEVMPDPLQTYGTAAQRLSWFQRGLDSGSFADCDTFAAEAAGKL